MRRVLREKSSAKSFQKLFLNIVYFICLTDFKLDFVAFLLKVGKRMKYIQ